MATTAHSRPAEKVPIFVFAAVVLVVVVGGAFAVGWMIGRMLL